MSYITYNLEKSFIDCTHPLVKSIWIAFGFGNNDEIILFIEMSLLDGTHETFESASMDKCVEKAEEYLKKIDSINSQTLNNA